MNKFMDLKETQTPEFMRIFNDLNCLYVSGKGILYRLYFYLKGRSLSIFPAARKWEYPWAILNSHCDRGNRVLDAGCGGSPLLLYLRKRGCICYGLDNRTLFEMPTAAFSLKFRICVALSRFFPLYYLFNCGNIEQLSLDHRVLGLDVNYIKGGLDKLPFEDGSFDRIFCISVIEHINEADILVVAAEFNRVLKRGGLLVTTIDLWGTGLLWKEFINASGLRLVGESDFSVPAVNKLGYNVVGLVLTKQ